MRLMRENSKKTFPGAMAVDAFAALFFGWLFDKVGLKALILSTCCSTFFACPIFLMYPMAAATGIKQED